MPYSPHETRDLVGYGRTLPHAQWPNNARVCISFVLNYEEGGENSPLEGDARAEAYLTEFGPPSGPPPEGLRNLSIESCYEYGSHRGFWRVLDLFREHNFVFTSWSVGRAVEHNPQVVGAMQEAGCEVASHAYRWIDHSKMPEEEEREHVNKAIDAIQKASPTHQPPIGWYTGRQSLQTRRIVYEEYKKRGLHKELYESDAYDEDLPYYVPAPDGTMGEHMLVIPYTLDVNDMKFCNTPGFFNSESFYQYMVDAFETLVIEGATSPRMMSIGLHCRIVGRPARAMALRRFLGYVKRRQAELEAEGSGVWVATRQQIAEHWRKTHPPTQ
ncbi:carbohydrate hydrolase [Malassezia pachydermatis]|uniref:Chitin deacetylase n=1 Tax=Malassezia pachydermatis TaxID=77020 RepID=A0A0M8MKZ2_9BASI|nr:chitin deacetylase [Malassezia pachydermatis]KOS13648.1 chitin deacetylase [Malassezia pachydermatis]